MYYQFFIRSQLSSEWNKYDLDTKINWFWIDFNFNHSALVIKIKFCFLLNRWNQFSQCLLRQCRQNRHPVCSADHAANPQGVLWVQPPGAVFLHPRGLYLQGAWELPLCGEGEVQHQPPQWRLWPENPLLSAGEQLLPSGLRVCPR